MKRLKSLYIHRHAKVLGLASHFGGNCVCEHSVMSNSWRSHGLQPKTSAHRTFQGRMVSWLPFPSYSRAPSRLVAWRDVLRKVWEGLNALGGLQDASSQHSDVFNCQPGRVTWSWCLGFCGPIIMPDFFVKLSNRTFYLFIDSRLHGSPLRRTGFLVAAIRGYSWLAKWASHCGGFSCCRAWTLERVLQCRSYAHGLRCLMACAIFPDWERTRALHVIAHGFYPPTPRKSHSMTDWLITAKDWTPSLSPLLPTRGQGWYHMVQSLNPLVTKLIF